MLNIFYECSQLRFTHLLVVQFSMNWTPEVTHTIAAVPSGVKYMALEKAGRDVIRLSWLLECERAGALLPLKPRHYLHLGPTTLQGASNVDCHGDG